MRSVLLLMLVGACTSFDAYAPEHVGEGSGSGSGGEGATQCSVDADCVTAGPKCCDCPTVAVPKSDPLHQACKDVQCPPAMCPDSVTAACQFGQCVLVCAAMTCQTTCANGFAVDENGCLTCTCAEVLMPTCSQDDQCAETRADCCGCARGGADTAVAKSDVMSYDQGLMCPTDPACPSVDICMPGYGPRCIQGACSLATATPADACGRSDLPVCPTGQSCIVNADATATKQGVGVCM